MTNSYVTFRRVLCQTIILAACAYLPLAATAQSSATATAGVSSGMTTQSKSEHPLRTDFLGLTIGMPQNQALKVMAKPSNALEPLRWIAGRRILDDTIPFADCALSMRRSVGFDSSNAVQVIGLTYKTTPKRIDAARDCAYRWLVATYGSPADSDTTGGTLVQSWLVGNARLTLEAKGYTQQDYFLLIYFYPVKP